MKNELAITIQLLNIEKHEAVEKNEHEKMYIPVTVVRSLAHELIIELRKQEAKEAKVLELVEKAGEILRGLNIIRA